MRSNDVAKLAGVTVRTLRHYHQLGLLSEPPRRANGYRDYSPADVARVLRIKRLAALGFPLSRIGDVLEEMDAEEHATSASALDELDRELALEIARLQEQRRTIAELRAEHLDPDLPVRFARILRKLAGVDSLAETSPDDRTALIVAAHLYDEKELERYRRTHTGDFTLQRYKGLGEMDAGQLWETTLDPERRVLKQVEIEDARMASEITEMLMGSEVAPRREFIYEHADEAEIDA